MNKTVWILIGAALIVIVAVIFKRKQAQTEITALQPAPLKTIKGNLSAKFKNIDPAKLKFAVKPEIVEGKSATDSGSDMVDLAGILERANKMAISQDLKI